MLGNHKLVVDTFSEVSDLIENFIDEMAKYYNIYIYSNGVKDYVEEVLKMLRNHNKITAIYTRKSIFDSTEKDLSKIGLNPNNTIIIDDYFDMRLKLYQTRKEYMIDALEKEAIESIAFYYFVQFHLDAQLQQEKQAYADRMAQYADSLAQRIAAGRASQQNANTSFQQQLKLMKERAYGQAKSQGFQNMANAASQAAMLATLV